MKDQSKEEYVSSCDLGIIYAGLGDKDQAFAFLERADEERSNWSDFLRVDPSLYQPRPDPRFTLLLKEKGLDK